MSSGEKIERFSLLRHTQTRKINMRKPAPLFFSIYLLSILIYQSILLTQVHANTDVYIVYLGGRQHDDVDLLTDSHHDMLANVVGSKELATKSMVYSYRHGFSGFAAKLTKSQAQQLAGLPEVVQVIRSTYHTLQTTRSWDSLGLGLSPQSPNNLLHKSKGGDGIIIGVLDSGISPESKSFSDKGMGPIPSRWKGTCVSGEKFNASKVCNKKIIGALWFVDGVIKGSNLPYNASHERDFLSPRDGSSGHGTHVSSTAAGAYVANVSYKGLAHGTVRGGAPRARLAMYKVCWNIEGHTKCTDADILAAMDQAIHDGVDLISVSIGSASFPIDSDVDESNGVGIGSFHAVSKGIPVVCAAGNYGPMDYTVGNTEPWVITVAASTLDRSFATPITLGNNKTLLGKAAFRGNETGFRGVIDTLKVPCQDLVKEFNATDMPANVTEEIAGMAFFCFTEQEFDVISGALAVNQVRGAGIIIAKSPNDILLPCIDGFPFFVEVDYEIGTQIATYIQSASSPTIKVSHSKTIVSKAVPIKLAHFSSRGPNSAAPAILKPDITAPGVNILAATSPEYYFGDNGFAIESGTSMATPHISGIVALLKALHPNWSPAAIKSALMTTARETNQYGLPIFAEGKPADAFDLGAGIVNPNGAANPGLLYDMGRTDYINYLCAMGFKKTAISMITQQPISCPAKRPSLLDVNLPSITIPSLRKSTTLTRTVTNVGAINSVYKAVIKPPPGTKISVAPSVLTFNSKTKTISFKVTVSSLYRVNSGYVFGSLTWTDRVHSVRIPISVKPETFKVCVNGIC